MNEDEDDGGRRDEGKSSHEGSTEERTDGPPSAQRDLNIQETCDRDRKVDTSTSYRAEECRVAHMADARTSLLVGELVLPLGLTPTPAWGFSN